MVNFYIFWATFDKNPDLPFLVTFLPFFFLGGKNYCVCTLSPLNGFKIGQKKKEHRFEKCVTGLLPRMLFLANFSKY